jgi:hypothetical protein
MVFTEGARTTIHISTMTLLHDTLQVPKPTIKQTCTNSNTPAVRHTTPLHKNVIKWHALFTSNNKPNIYHLHNLSCHTTNTNHLAQHDNATILFLPTSHLLHLIQPPTTVAITTNIQTPPSSITQNNLTVHPIQPLFILFSTATPSTTLATHFHLPPTIFSNF